MSTSKEWVGDPVAGGYLEQMSTAPDPYGYRMVPLDVVTEIGKVTVVAAHVEADLYRIGDMCEVDKARAMPATQLANVLAQRVRDKALPECLEDLTPALMRGTAGAVPVLKERHEVIHGAISFERTTEHDWRATSRRSKEDAKKRLVAVERLVAQRQELERVATALTPVWVALLMDGRGPLIKAVDIEILDGS